MATSIKSQEENYQIYKDEVQAEAGDLTDFSDGSMHDIIAGSLSIGINEVSELLVDQFKKTFFDTASGPEVTEGPDDLQTLAVDHYGDKFERPEATKAGVLATFARPTTGAGNVVIPDKTVIKTEKDSNGVETSFETDGVVTMTGLTIDVPAIAKEAGVSGNVDPGKISVIESSLTDSSITVTNLLKAAGGDAAESDADYRETIRALISSLVGATKAAIEGALKAVPEIEFVSLLEIELPVIAWDIGNSQPEPGETYFTIPFPIAYVADQNGGSSPAILEAALAAIQFVKACGVKVEVRGATAQSLDWSASITLDSGGPNFAELSADPQKIIDSMINYIDEQLKINDGFSRSLANAYILGIWGPTGTGDLTQFTTNTPSGDIAGQSGVKLISGTVGIS